jgi:hypothetical protein
MIYFGESSMGCWEECILGCCSMEYYVDIFHNKSTDETWYRRNETQHNKGYILKAYYTLVSL